LNLEIEVIFCGHAWLEHKVLIVFIPWRTLNWLVARQVNHQRAFVGNELSLFVDWDFIQGIACRKAVGQVLSEHLRTQLKNPYCVDQGKDHPSQAGPEKT
jgi:hypothetical protein